MLTKMIFPLLLILSGCAGLGLQPAESFNDRVAYALGVHTAVLESTTRAVDFGDLSSEEGRHILELSDDARNLIDVARTVHTAGDLPEANRRLALSLAILQELQDFLRSRDR